MAENLGCSSLINDTIKEDQCDYYKINEENPYAGRIYWSHNRMHHRTNRRPYWNLLQHQKHQWPQRTSLHGQCKYCGLGGNCSVSGHDFCNTQSIPTSLVDSLFGVSALGVIYGNKKQQMIRQEELENRGNAGVVNIVPVLPIMLAQKY